MGLFRSEGKVYKPVEDVDLSRDSKEEYIHPEVKAPRMAGFLVKLSALILESRIFGFIALHIMKGGNLVFKLVSLAEIKEPPLFFPSNTCEDVTEQEVKFIQPDLSPCEHVRQAMECLTPHPFSIVGDPSSNFRRWTIRDFYRAYTSGETTPLKVLERFIASVNEASKPHIQMSFFIDYNIEDILRQAKESTSRYDRGEALSVLDGVPIAVKDEIDCMPYPTTGGSKWLHKLRHCTDDACCVRHLKSCGAILVGKTNMHELGMGTSGINPHYGVARNPYNRTKVSGGSSSGSAAVVAAGLCPVTLGVDGGGSVRMPAALCGVIGFKPTFGRFSHSGVIPLNWTVGMIGILAGTVEDAFLVYAAMIGNVSSSQLISLPPKINFPLLQSSESISNIKLAKSLEWFDDCTNDIRNCCNRAVDQLCEFYGWKTVEVTLPEIEEMRLAHYVTIGSECSASLGPYLEKLDATELGWDARVALCVYGSFTSKDYINAQRLRNRQKYFHKEIFKRADVIVTPTTGVTAYTIGEDALNSGELDYINGAALIRYQIAGNFLGLPAVTIPVGYDKSGLPIGLQFIGRPWSEATLLHLASAMQALCIKSCRKPEVFYDILSEQ